MLGCMLYYPIYGHIQQTKMEDLRDKAELFTLISIFLISVIALTPAT